MASRPSLSNGTVLKKLWLLILLALSGLDYPPNACEAVKCINCQGNIEFNTTTGKIVEVCISSGSQQADCPQGCKVFRALNKGHSTGAFEKGCYTNGEDPSPSVLQCVQQQELQQGTGNCIESQQQHFGSAFTNCKGEAPQAPPNPNSYDSFVYCTCQLELCNEQYVTHDSPPGGSIGVSAGDGGKGQSSSSGAETDSPIKPTILGGVAGIMINLAIKWLPN